MNYGSTLGEHLTMAASASMYYMVIKYKNKTNMKEVASNINIKIHQLFSRQRILGVRVTTVQRKTSVDLTRTFF